MSGFEVMTEQCDQCLYGPNKIVSDARRKQTIREMTQKDCHFICHKATIEGRNVCCRADYDRRPSQMVRIAERLGVVNFVRLGTDPQSRTIEEGK